MGGWALGWLVHALFLSLIGETNGGATCLCKASLGWEGRCFRGATQYCYSETVTVGRHVSKTSHSAGY